MSLFSILVIGVTWLAILGGCFLGWQLLGQNGRILLRLEGLEKRLNSFESGAEIGQAALPLDSPAPEFELPDLAGQRHTLAEYRGEPLLLIFFNPDCGFCRDLTPKLVTIRGFAKGIQKTESERRPLPIILSTGEQQKNKQFFDEHKIDSPVLLQNETEVADAYQARGTPTGYLISSEGKIASQLAVGAESLLALALGKTATENEADQEPGPASGKGDGREDRFSQRSLAQSKIKRDGLAAGTMAPEFRLPRLDGGELSLSELRGQLVLLVFSSPHCGPCNTLAPRLEKFHRKHPNLQLVMISRGDLNENHEKVEQHGLTFPVMLQKQWEISRQYALFASPVGYLIDRAGVITADVAVGIDPILDLMKRAEWMLQQDVKPAKLSFSRRLARLPFSFVFGAVRQLQAGLGTVRGKLDIFELKYFRYAPRADDIFIVTYPRSGTTWMQMILYQLTTDGSMDIPHIAERSPWFEQSMYSEKGFEDLPSPRVFKSHLPYGKIPKGPGRYIYVMRDGRDVALSYYHLYRTHNSYHGTFTEFFELFMRGKVIFGSWFDHIGGWLKHRHKLNVLFLTYEELMRDLEGSIRRIIAFCHLDVPEEKLPVILERCSFAFMKQHEDKFDPAVEVVQQRGTIFNSFLRAGRMGQGARQLSTEDEARFDQAFQDQLGRFDFNWPARIENQTEQSRRRPAATELEASGETLARAT